MFNNFPSSVPDMQDWPWSRFEPYQTDLLAYQLTAGNIEEWLSGWSKLAGTFFEMQQRLDVDRSCHTNEDGYERRYHHFLDHLYPHIQVADQRLKEKLLASGLEPQGFEIPLHKMRSDAAIFCEANVSLLSEERKLITVYDKIIGSQTINWEGKEITVSQVRPVYQQPERVVREHAWRMAAERQLADRAEINTLWVKFLNIRNQIAKNAGFDSYRNFRWQQLHRFDYTPAACTWFQDAIAEVVVPAAQRIYEKRRQALGVVSLRPWDLNVDPYNRPPLHPYQDVDTLIEKIDNIFQQIDPQLGAYFRTMRTEKLLDVDNRKGKAPGGFCTAFIIAKRPFIFMNAVGMHDDVTTLLHESGHAFHVFEANPLPYMQQKDVPLEFAEVASLSMELMAAPYLAMDKGGFYSEADIIRTRREDLEGWILFWPYMAVVDAFQHWVYEHLEEAKDPTKCDTCWAELWQRFMPGVDWSGLEQEMLTGWQRKAHIFTDPFYYVEYGVAQFGALQVWRNALDDQARTLRAYRRALALGGTATLPELYAAAGSKFILSTLDINMLKEAVSLMESILVELDD